MVLIMQGIMRMLKLTSIIVRTTDTGISFGRKKSNVNKKGMSIAGFIILSFVLVYFGAVILFVSNGIYEVLAPMHWQSAMLGLSTSVFAFIIFFFGIFYIISVFYFTKDIENLLALPLNAWEIIGGKFLSVIIFEYITTSLVLIPYFVYGIKSGAGILFYIYSILVFLLLPVIPLAITAIIIMPVMRFVKFARNKDLFNMVAGVLVLILVFGGNIFLSQLGINGEMAGGIGSLIQGGGEKISSLTSMLFPGTWFAGQSLTLSSEPIGFLYLILFAFTVLLAFIFVLFLANHLYIKAATAVSSSNASHKKLNMQEIRKTASGKPAFFTYMIKDLLILVRTPIYLLNNVIMNFLWPLLILVITVMNKNSSTGSGDPLAMLKNFDYSNSSKMGIVLLIVFAGSVLISSMNGIASSALSREGSCFDLMKYIPMSYFSQIMAKVMVGYSLSLAGVLCGIIAICIIAIPPVWVVILSILIALPAALLPNVTGIIYELLWPKLHWDNEQKAVKQNLNVMLGMFIPLAVTGLIITLGILVQLNLWQAFTILFFGTIIIDAAVILILRKIIPIRMQKIVY
jgi:ABC-2 type transport system permease protein